MSGAPGSYLKNFSAQNLTVLPQIVVVNKYSLWVSVCLCVWSTDRQPIAIWNCQEGTAAKAKRNIRVIFLRHGKKFPFLPLSPCVWWSHNLELHLILVLFAGNPTGSLPPPRRVPPPHPTGTLFSVVFTELLYQSKRRCFHISELMHTWLGSAEPLPFQCWLCLCHAGWAKGSCCSPRLHSCANWESYKTKSSIFNKELFHTSRCSCYYLIAYKVNSTWHIKYTIWLVYIQANILGLNWIPLPTRKVHRRQWCQSGNSP